jgi:hypothetical protein
MAWDKLRRLFAREAKSDGKIPSVSWIEAAANPWGVRVLDVRPVKGTRGVCPALYPGTDGWVGVTNRPPYGAVAASSCRPWKCAS